MRAIVGRDGRKRFIGKDGKTLSDNEVAWMNWSCDEAGRLITLHVRDLIQAVAADALANLVPDDREKVLRHLVKEGVPNPSAIGTQITFRTPHAIKGENLSCGPHRLHPIDQPIVKISLFLIGGFVAWVLVIAFGLGIVFEAG